MRSCTCAMAADRPRAGPQRTARARLLWPRGSPSVGIRRHGRCRAAASSASPRAAHGPPTARTGTPGQHAPFSRWHLYLSATCSQIGRPSMCYRPPRFIA